MTEITIISKVKVKLLSHVQLFGTPWTVAYQAPQATVHGIFQARVLEWVAISFSRGSSQPSDWTWVSLTADRRFTIWATGKPRTISKGRHEIKKCKMCHQRIKQGRSDKKIYLWNVYEFQFSLFAQSCPTLCHPLDCSTPGFAVIEFQLLSLKACCLLQTMPYIQFSHSVVSLSLPPHRLQHASRPCPSPTPRACSNLCPSSQWRHPAIS